MRNNEKYKEQNDVRNSWEKNREIDDYQGELNMKENEMNRLLINLKIVRFVMMM